MDSKRFHGFYDVRAGGASSWMTNEAMAAVKVNGGSETGSTGPPMCGYCGGVAG